MEKYRAIPEGYMTVGELAKKMNTTVRTLQYYDKEGLLSPAAESEGGRRLYTDKDFFKLHQIQSLKYLGFSLDEIKSRPLDFDTPEQAAQMFDEQAAATKEKIASLTEVLDVLEKLKDETLQMKTVDFKKYADIIVNLQMKNSFYGLVKHMDDETLDYFHSRFDMGSAKEIISALNRVISETERMKGGGISSESEEAQAIGKEWWDVIMEFTGGDMAILPKLIEFAEKTEDWDPAWKTRTENVMGYLQEAMQAYFIKNNINPMEGIQE